MAAQWNISRIDGQPRYVLEHWQVLSVLPTGPCHSPTTGSRYLLFAGCIDRDEILHFSKEIVSFDPTQRLGKSLNGWIYQLGRSHGFTKSMTSNARRGFWAYSHKPQDKTAQVLSMMGGLNAQENNDSENLE